MAREPDRPIDDEMCQSVRAEDLIRNRGAPTRVEEVTLEEERDTRPPHCAEHVVEPGGIEAVAHGIALGAAIGRRRGADYGVDRVAATSRDEREKAPKVNASASPASAAPLADSVSAMRGRFRRKAASVAASISP